MLKSTGASRAQSPKDEIIAVLGRLGIDPPAASGALEARSPIDGRAIGRFNATEAGRHAKPSAGLTPRSRAGGECRHRSEASSCRLLGEELRAAKNDLGAAHHARGRARFLQKGSAKCRR